MVDVEISYLQPGEFEEYLAGSWWCACNVV